MTTPRICWPSITASAILEVIKQDRANRVVVGGDDEIDRLRVAVGVHDGDHGDVEAVRLVNRDLLFADIGHENGLWQAVEVAQAAEAPLQLGQIAQL